MKLQSPRTEPVQLGFTLVELMVGVVVGSIIMFMVLSIQGKMSSAFRSQRSASEINMNLRAARQHLVSEIRNAGFGLGSTGTVGVASGVSAFQDQRGVMVHDDLFGDGNDAFTVSYADGDAITVNGINGGRNWATLDDPPPAGLIGEPIIIGSRVASCLLRVTNTAASPNKIHFNPSDGVYNEAPQNPHCDDVKMTDSPVSIRRIRRRSYRIDPTRPNGGFLQMSPSGMMVAGDWIDLGAGFTTLQLASRFYEAADLVDSDLDGDPEHDWYSSNNQHEPDPLGVRPANAILLQLSLSLEARSVVGIADGTPSSATDAYTDLALVDHNRMGNWGVACPANPAMDPCGVDLVNTPDASRPARYRGDNIYRSSTTLIDLRNIGIGK